MGYSYRGTLGGFGGGGGFTYNDYSPMLYGGYGGFGAGGGTNGYAPSNDGLAGFGGSGQQAAGFGGALFVRSGQLILEAVQFNNNHAKGNGAAAGLGGAMFVQHITSQANGNNQGMPDSIPRVFGCSATFSNNSADTDPDTSLNNDDWFDLANTQIGLSGSSVSDTCLNDHEIQISDKDVEIASSDSTPDLVDGTDFGEVMANFQPKIATFKITNTGNSTLVLNGVERIELINNDSGMFSLVVLPGSDYIQSNQSLDFKVAFNPTNWIAYSATVIVMSSDEDEPVYSFDIGGQGIPYSELVFQNGFDNQ